jgi:uncharacterized membrane protein
MGLSKPDSEAIKLLQIRYAKGEITSEQYEEILKTLQKTDFSKSNNFSVARLGMTGRKIRIVIAIIVIILLALFVYNFVVLPLISNTVRTPSPNALTPIAIPAATIAKISPTVTSAETTTPPLIPASQPVFAPLKTVKDSSMLFTVQVPEDWNVTTIHATLGGNWGGDVNYINLLPDASFQITAYAYMITGMDQNLQNYYRQNMFGTPIESEAIIDGRSFDRFEVSNNTFDYVAYVGYVNAENEKGYDYSFAYILNQSTLGNRTEYEQIIHSFQILTNQNVGSTSGEEILNGPEGENIYMPFRVVFGVLTVQDCGNGEGTIDECLNLSPNVDPGVVITAWCNANITSDDQRCFVYRTNPAQT